MKKLLCYGLLCILIACAAPREGGSDTATTPAERRAGIDPDDTVIEIQSPQSLADYLRRVPGLIISGNNVSIRGRGAPLYIVDGVQIGRSYTQADRSVSVFDIDRVEVLKNAADLALYGYRGQNGVIKIYTKRE